MKKIAALLTVFLTIFIGVFPASASTQTSSAKKPSYLEFTEHATEFTINAPLEEYADYYLAKKLTVTKDFTLPKNTDLYIRAGGELVIKKEAGFTANGRVIVERGGRLSIQKGTFTETGRLKNFGEIEIGKNGSLILSGGGDYISNAGSRLTQEGDVLFGELRLSDLTERILKYDKNFSLDSYCVNAFNCGDNLSDRISRHEVRLYYCIGDIETDYYYKATNNTAHPKLTRKSYSLSRVYNVQRAEKLKRAAEKYADENDLYQSYTDPSCFEVEIGFKYSYKTRNLDSYAYSYQAAWWDWQGEDEEEFYYRANVHEEKVGRF